uniref:Uncharacterized protein n=1 Tax=Arundo donax TaxID=35708 RepID=A0A0A9BKG8_ARUDO
MPEMVLTPHKSTRRPRSSMRKDRV